MGYDIFSNRILTASGGSSSQEFDPFNYTPAVSYETLNPSDCVEISYSYEIT